MQSANSGCNRLNQISQIDESNQPDMGAMITCRSGFMPDSNPPMNWMIEKKA
jgi:hypothetical protein